MTKNVTQGIWKAGELKEISKTPGFKQKKFDLEAYLTIEDSKVTKEEVDALISASAVETCQVGEKTTLVSVTLPNGFVITETSACVDAANYDSEIGQQICLKRVADKVWGLLGFLLQEKLYVASLVDEDEDEEEVEEDSEEVDSENSDKPVKKLTKAQQKAADKKAKKDKAAEASVENT